MKLPVQWELLEQKSSTLTASDILLNGWEDTVLAAPSDHLEWLSPGHDGTGIQVWCRGPGSL